MATKSKLKSQIRNVLVRVPYAGRVVLGTYHQVALLRRQVASRLNALRSPQLPDADTVYWIDPARIVYHTNYSGGDERKPAKDRVFGHERDRGKVIGGNWDISDFKFDDLQITQAIYSRIHEGTPWQKTTFYGDTLRTVAEKGVAGWGIDSESALEAHCKGIDALIDSIRTLGYRLNHEVEIPGERKGLDSHPRYTAEISVNIGRTGRFFFQDGRHRLAVAKALGLPRVPVKVLVRHQQWNEFREFVRTLSRGGGASSHSGELYQNALHPDLQDIPAGHACEDRLAAIKAHVQPGQGDALDIGCNLGYFCHGLEELGYSCYAVEYLPQVAMAADKIRIAEDKKFRVLTGDFFELSAAPPLRGRKFSVVLALNIFHHFLKREETFLKLRQWLGTLDAETMIFEPHVASEAQMAGAYTNFGPDEFVKFILDNSTLRHAEPIHRCSDGRVVYKLWR